MDRILKFGAAICLTASTFVSPVAAEETSDIIAYERQILADSCTTIEFMPGFIDVTDLNDDGVDDAIIDYQYLNCDGSNMAFCGTGGCTLRLYSGRGSGRFTEAADMLSQGLKLVRRSGKTYLAISVRGSECGKSGAKKCTITGRLKDGEFAVDSRK